MFARPVLSVWLAVLWCMLFEDFRPGALLMGFAVGAAVLFFFRRMLGEKAVLFRKQATLRKLAAVCKLLVSFLCEMVLANIQVAWLIVLLSIHYNSTAHFDSVLVIAVLGFLGTVAVAKYLLKGDIID